MIIFQLSGKRGDFIFGVIHRADIGKDEVVVVGGKEGGYDRKLLLGTDQVEISQSTSHTRDI
jgi:hypothetical protein